MFVVVLIIFVFLGMFLDLSSIGSEEEADGSHQESAYDGSHCVL